MVAIGASRLIWLDGCTFTSYSGFNLLIINVPCHLSSSHHWLFSTKHESSLQTTGWMALNPSGKTDSFLSCKRTPHFVEPRGSLPRSQEPATGLCHMLVQSGTQRYIILLSTSKGRDSAAFITMGYGLDERDLIPGRAKKFFSTTQCPDRIWSPLNVIWNRYQGLLPQG